MQQHDLQGLASHDACKGFACSTTLPEAAAYTQRLQEVQDEMAMGSPFAYSAMIDPGWSTFVRSCSPICP